MSSACTFVLAIATVFGVLLALAASAHATWECTANPYYPVEGEGHCGAQRVNPETESLQAVSAEISTDKMNVPYCSYEEWVPRNPYTTEEEAYSRYINNEMWVSGSLRRFNQGNWVEAGQMGGREPNSEHRANCGEIRPFWEAYEFLNHTREAEEEEGYGQYARSGFGETTFEENGDSLSANHEYEIADSGHEGLWEVYEEETFGPYSERPPEWERVAVVFQPNVTIGWAMAGMEDANDYPGENVANYWLEQNGYYSGVWEYFPVGTPFHTHTNIERRGSEDECVEPTDPSVNAGALVAGISPC